jgi:hypothetical protein
MSRFYANGNVSFWQPEINAQSIVFAPMLRGRTARGISDPTSYTAKDHLFKRHLHRNAVETGKDREYSRMKGFHFTK